MAKSLSRVKSMGSLCGPLKKARTLTFESKVWRKASVQLPAAVPAASL